MANHERTPVVAVSSNTKKLAGESTIYTAYAPLADELQARGVMPVALHGKNEHSKDNEFTGYYTFGENGLERQDAEIAVDAARDLTGGIARYTTVAALNPANTRGAVASKKTQIDILRSADVSVTPQTYFVEPEDDIAIADALTSIKGDKVIIKPEISQAGINVISGTKSDVASRISEYRDGKRTGSGLMLVQQYIPDIQSPFPSQLTFMPGEADKVSLIANNEIRVHVIDEEPVLFHGKTSIKGNESDYNDSQLVFFDQDNWPPHVYDLAKTVAKAFRAHTQDSDSYLAVDFTPGGQMVTEVNGKNPVTIRPRNASEAGYETHVIWKDMLANKLAAMANREYALRKGGQ